MTRNKETFYLALIGAFIFLTAYLWFQKVDTGQVPKSNPEKVLPLPKSQKQNPSSNPSSHNTNRIDELTQAEVVISFVKQQGVLPDYYITKADARRQGWQAGAGNLCEVLPGKAIGGDVFTNRQGVLPKKAGRIYYEADLNYQCGRRNADRLVFSNDGLVFVTYDHYKTFEKK